MGRQWNRGGRSSTKKGSGGGGGGEGGGGGGERNPSGCMGAVLQLFDFHPFHFALHQQPPLKPDYFLPEDTTILKGVEAPRNSLESEEPIREAASSLSSIIEEEESLNTPMEIQIKTSGDAISSKEGTSKARTDDLSSESICSPGTKTPNLVARLMGLDLLPESSSSPSLSSNHGASIPLGKSQLQYLQAQNVKCEFRSRHRLQIRQNSHRSFFDNDFTGTRSLPETPRISSARRSDVDPRLSLQINKDNISFSEELFPRCSLATTARKRELKREDENRSPSLHARQIVKHLKESVSRRVGHDITNTIENKDQRAEQLAMPIKLRKSSKVVTKVVNELSPSKHSTPSCSPRLRFLEPRNKTISKSFTKDQTYHSSQPSISSLSSTFTDNQALPIKSSSKPNSQPLLEQQKRQQKSHEKHKKAGGARFRSRLKKPPQAADAIRNKQEEPFVRSTTSARGNNSDRKCRKTPLSNDLVNISTVPTLVPSKKLDRSPPTTKTKIPKEQSQVPDAQPPKRSSQLPSCPNPLYKQQQATQTLSHRDGPRDRCKGATYPGGGGRADFQYIARILKCSGIDNNTPISLSIWFSPSHPLDPSIFRHLERSFLTTTTTAAATVIATTTTAAATTILGDSELNFQCNRKLIFNLVDEILVDILKPFINLKPWVTSKFQRGQNLHGRELLEHLCTKIRSFPLADCRVLEDIDALIDRDLTESKVQSAQAYEEEGEGIVFEIEKDILDSLVQETAVLFGAPVSYRNGATSVWQRAAEPAGTPSHGSFT